MVARVVQARHPALLELTDTMGRMDLTVHLILQSDLL
jgi:hypothetical protein